MTTGELQQQVFDAVKNKRGESTSVVDEIALLLNISSDSAYRRMRGEKTLSLDELQLICQHYKLSADQLLGLSGNQIVFQGQYMDKDNYRMEDYLKSVLNTLGYLNSFNEKCFYYVCKDLPVFHNYQVKEVAAFKWFFWLKTYFHFPGFEKRKFRFSDFPDELFDLGKKLLAQYNQLPSVEIWNLETMNHLFRQIDFYRDGDVFESDEDLLRMYDAIDKLWTHLEKQASVGYKFDVDDPKQKRMGDFKMYFNEVWIGDNSILVEMDGNKISYIAHTTINFMMTRDKTFNENLYRHIQNIMQKSTLISEVSEKERARFFRITRDKIANRKESLKV